ncbi:MAG: primosomal protein N' [Desulfobacterales bacterium]|nr:primosomal protein N' [Desulfobacterales bacterium]
MTGQTKYIAVAVTLPLYPVYTYSVPKDLLNLAVAGKRVLVPFGKRRITGYICGPGQSDGTHTIRPILAILDQAPLFPESMLPFFQWVADYYMHPLGEVIKTALPGGLNVYDVATYAVTAQGQAALAGEKAQDSERQILDVLKKENRTYKSLARALGGGVPAGSIPGLLKKGWIEQQRTLRGGRTRAKLEKHVTAIPGFKVTGRLSEGRGRILAALDQQGTLPLSALKKLVPTAPRLVNAMVHSGQVGVEHRAVYRDPLGQRIVDDQAHRLNAEQQQVIATVAARMGVGFSAFLLAGVTGSGKTEVYMHLAQKVLGQGLSVLVLVPEIALISQMERRFRARFGECVAVLHSGLSAGERFDQWRRISRGDVSIAIGARSAVFAPFAALGLVVVDEEHDASYKQDGGLRYNARDLAVVRARGSDCPVVLGSATPSIQSWYNVSTGKFEGLELTGRVARRPMPEITTVDLREARHARGVQRFFTPQLKAAMAATLQRGEQVLLFLNRRGFASYPVCGECGEAVTCKNCDISLTLHQAAKAYQCHYCGFSQAATTNCRACGSSRIIMLGVGTERVEEAVAALFPQAVVARMDSDTTARKGAVVGLLKKLHLGRIDILVGTQMVAKGHDFPNITLVGILCADLSLSFPDFRSGARTFQLLAQVAGRAGRGERPGKVILQTYNPDHFSITSACAQDFKSFYGREIAFRQALGYPPFTRFVQLRISGKARGKVREQAAVLGEHCRRLSAGQSSAGCAIVVMGPIESPMTRIAGRYRRQILVKSGSTAALHRLVRTLRVECAQLFARRDVRVAVDVDPIFMM